MAIVKRREIRFVGVQGAKNISAVELVGDYLFLGADESHSVQILKRDGDRFEAFREVVLNADKREIDIEGIAARNGTVYVLGSHSRVRARLDPTAPYEANRAALYAAPAPLEARDFLGRFRFSDGEVTELETTSLRSLIDGDELLRPFSQLASKENGVDLEGLAVRGKWVYVGFRGPVLRGNLVPVLRCQFGPIPGEADVRFVDLGGRGIRDLTRVRGGFLILAGPMGDGPGSYRVYFWDGEDCVPGERSVGRMGRVESLCKVPVEGGAKAEGITLLKESDTAYDVLVVFDGKKNGGPTRLRVKKP
jgi:hypothetical protein